MSFEIVSASSLKNAEVRLALAIDAAIQAAADLDRIRVKAGMDPAEKGFYLAAEARILAAEARAEGAAEAKAAKPEATSWRSNPKYAAPKPSEYPLWDPLTALRATVAALRHPELGLELDDHAAMVECLVAMCGGASREPTGAELKEISSWSERWAKGLAQAGAAEVVRRFPNDDPLEVAAAFAGEPRRAEAIRAAYEAARANGPWDPPDRAPAPPKPPARAIAAIDGDNVVPIGSRAAIADFIKRSYHEAEDPRGGGKGRK